MLRNLTESIANINAHYSTVDSLHRSPSWIGKPFDRDKHLMYHEKKRLERAWSVNILQRTSALLAGSCTVWYARRVLVGIAIVKRLRVLKDVATYVRADEKTNQKTVRPPLARQEKNEACGARWRFIPRRAFKSRFRLAVFGYRCRTAAGDFGASRASQSTDDYRRSAGFLRNVIARPSK